MWIDKSIWNWIERLLHFATFPTRSDLQSISSMEGYLGIIETATIRVLVVPIQPIDNSLFHSTLNSMRLQSVVPFESLKFKAEPGLVHSIAWILFIWRQFYRSFMFRIRRNNTSISFCIWTEAKRLFNRWRSSHREECFSSISNSKILWLTFTSGNWNCRLGKTNKHEWCP